MIQRDQGKRKVVTQTEPVRICRRANDYEYRCQPHAGSPPQCVDELTLPPDLDPFTRGRTSMYAKRSCFRDWCNGPSIGKPAVAVAVNRIEVTTFGQRRFRCRNREDEHATVVGR